MADDSIGASLRRQHLKPVVALKLIHPIDFGGHGAVLDLPEKATAELAVYPPPAVFEGGVTFVKVTYLENSYMIPFSNIAWFRTEPAK